MRTQKRAQTTRDFTHLRQRFLKACDDKQSQLKTDYKDKDYHMTQAFAQLDSNHSGKLSVADMKRALGPGHLGLGVRGKDIDHVVRNMPRSSAQQHTDRTNTDRRQITDRRQMVTYRRFVRGLDLNNSTDPNPEYNSFVDENDHCQRSVLVGDTSYRAEPEWTGGAYLPPMPPMSAPDLVEYGHGPSQQTWRGVGHRPSGRQTGREYSMGMSARSPQWGGSSGREPQQSSRNLQTGIWHQQANASPAYMGASDRFHGCHRDHFSAPSGRLMVNGEHGGGAAAVGAAHRENKLAVKRANLARHMDRITGDARKTEQGWQDRDEARVDRRRGAFQEADARARKEEVRKGAGTRKAANRSGAALNFGTSSESQLAAQQQDGMRLQTHNQDAFRR